MKKLINKFFLKNSEAFKKWGREHFLELIIFNIIIIILLLLRSAGYFSPFLQLTINFIFLISFLLCIFLLGAKSQILFIFSFIFWIFAAFLRILQIDIWAERTVIYAFQTLVIGIVMIVFENKK